MCVDYFGFLIFTCILQVYVALSYIGDINKNAPGMRYSRPAYLLRIFQNFSYRSQFVLMIQFEPEHTVESIAIILVMSLNIESL